MGRCIRVIRTGRTMLTGRGIDDPWNSIGLGFRKSSGRTLRIIERGVPALSHLFCARRDVLARLGSNT